MSFPRAGNAPSSSNNAAFHLLIEFLWKCSRFRKAAKYAQIPQMSKLLQRTGARANVCFSFFPPLPSSSFFLLYVCRSIGCGRRQETFRRILASPGGNKARPRTRPREHEKKNLASGRDGVQQTAGGGKGGGGSAKRVTAKKASSLRHRAEAGWKLILLVNSRDQKTSQR